MKAEGNIIHLVSTALQQAWHQPRKWWVGVGVGGGAVSWQAKWYCTMVPCLLMRRVQIELNRTVIVSRKPLNSVQARNQILPQVHIALQITCCLYQLILFRSAAFSPFSSTAEVIQRHQLQLRQSKRGRRCRVRNGWPEIRGKVL